MFVNTDLVNTFTSANESKDDFLKSQSLITKLGELILKDRPDVVSLLKKRQIKISGKESDNIVLSMMMEQILRSDDFASDLFVLLLKKEQKSEAFLKTSDSKKLIKSGVESLKQIAKDKSIVNKIIESKKTHTFFMATGGETKGNTQLFWNIAIIGLAGIILYKLYQMNQAKNGFEEIEENGIKAEEKIEETATEIQENGTGNIEQPE